MRYDIRTKSETDKWPEAVCAFCGVRIEKKTRVHKFCSGNCRWKQAIKNGTDAAKRAVARSAIWYQNNKERHKANVKTRKKTNKCRLKEGFLSPHTLSIDTENASTVGSVTSELSVRSLSPQTALTTSRTTIVASIGGEQNR